MDAERWERAQELFLAAADLPAAERSGFLRERCGGDGDLLREVESLLAAEAASGGPAPGPGDFIRRAVSAALPSGTPARLAAGSRIGAWRLIEPIGSGGMGVVWLAERADSDYEQRVAVKLLRSTLAGEHDVRRFTAERRILAALGHPGIARLLDGGETGDGTPYLVMEHVQGQPVDAWCRANAKDVRARVRLFVKVCEAAAYAHRNLVVHRDLKPSNILVSVDGDPKLVDFGIAKLLEETDAPGEVTGTRFRAMTPAYASPEQILGRAIGVGSDIYSLGVVLYELLADDRPYEIGTTSPAAAARIVAESEPARPSTRALRRGDARTARSLRGDLDNIVLRALAKEPERRYASASDLAEDLKRWLDGRPVQARPDTWRYRTAKFVARNRIGVTAAAVAVLALLTATGVSLHFAASERSQRALAEARFDDVHELATTFLEDVDDALAGEGKIAARELIVSTGLEYLDRLAAEAGSDRGLLRDLASGYLRVATIQGSSGHENLGLAAEALANVRKGRAIAETLFAAAPADPGSALLAVRARLLHASLMEHEGDTEAMELLFASAFDERERLDRATVDAERAPRADEILRRWGQALESHGRLEEAVAKLQESIARVDALMDARPDSPDLEADRLNAVVQLGQVHQRRGDWEAVRAWLEPARDRLLEIDPEDSYRRRTLATAHLNLGRTYDELGLRDDAGRELTAALEAERTILAADPEDRSARRRLSTVHHWLGRLRDNQGDWEAAYHHMSEMLRIRRAMVDGDPESAVHRRDLAVALDMTGSVLRKLGRKDEALDLGLRANGIFRELADEDPGNADVRRSVAVSCYFLGLLQREMADDFGSAGDAAGRRARLDDARGSFERARTVMEALRDEGTLPPGDEGVIDMLADLEAKAVAALGR